MSLESVGKLEHMPSVYTSNILFDERNRTLTVEYDIPDYYNQSGLPTWATNEFLSNPVFIKMVVSFNSSDIERNRAGGDGLRIVRGDLETEIPLSSLKQTAAEYMSYGLSDFTANFNLVANLNLGSDAYSGDIVVYSYLFFKTSDVLDVEPRLAELSGPVIVDVIKRENRFAREGFRLLDNGEVYSGPFHKMPNQEIYMKTSYHNDIEETQLTIERTYNRKLKIMKKLTSSMMKELPAASTTTKYVAEPLCSYEHSENLHTTHALTKIDLKAAIEGNIPVLKLLGDSLIPYNYLSSIDSVFVLWDRSNEPVINSSTQFVPIKINSVESTGCIYGKFTMNLASFAATTDLTMDFYIDLNASDLQNQAKELVLTPLSNVFSDMDSYFTNNRTPSLPRELKQRAYEAIVKTASVVFRSVGEEFINDVKNMLESERTHESVFSYLKYLKTQMEQRFNTFIDNSVNTQTEYQIGSHTKTVYFSTTGYNISYMQQTSAGIFYKTITELRERLKRESLKVIGNNLIHDKKQYLTPEVIKGNTILSFSQVLEQLNVLTDVLFNTDNSYQFDISSPHWNQLSNEIVESKIEQFFLSNFTYLNNDEVPYILKKIAYTIFYENNYIDQSGYDELSLNEFYDVLYANIPTYCEDVLGLTSQANFYNESIAVRRIILTTIMLNLRHVQVLDQATSSTEWNWKTVTPDILNELLSSTNKYTIMRLQLESPANELIKFLGNESVVTTHEDTVVEDHHYILSTEDISAVEYYGLYSVGSSDTFSDFTAAWLLENSYSLVYDDTPNYLLKNLYTDYCNFNPSRLSVLNNESTSTLVFSTTEPNLGY